MESSVAETHDEMLQVLKEKMRLEGQLEALSLEASQVNGDLMDVSKCRVFEKNVQLLFVRAKLYMCL